MHGHKQRCVEWKFSNGWVQDEGFKGVPLEQYVFIFSPSTKKPFAVWVKYATHWTFLTEINK